MSSAFNQRSYPLAYPADLIIGIQSAAAIAEVADG